jgi:hypothetical protein
MGRKREICVYCASGFKLAPTNDAMYDTYIMASRSQYFPIGNIHSSPLAYALNETFGCTGSLAGFGVGRTWKR